MKRSGEHIIYTIGHSTHSWEDFLSMLKSFDIRVLVDIRTFPGSRKFPQFDQENMIKELPENGIQYLHMKELGGRRKPKKDSKNDRWRNTSFRGYADYMETAEFKNAVGKLKGIASANRTAYMCSEAVWWRCHRALVSDFLKVEGWNVQHIMATGKSQEHPYTSPAIVVDGEIYYSDRTLFD